MSSISNITNNKIIKNIEEHIPQYLKSFDTRKQLFEDIQDSTITGITNSTNYDETVDEINENINGSVNISSSSWLSNTVINTFEKKLEINKNFEKNIYYNKALHVTKDLQDTDDIDTNDTYDDIDEDDEELSQQQQKPIAYRNFIDSEEYFDGLSMDTSSLLYQEIKPQIYIPNQQKNINDTKTIRERREKYIEQLYKEGKIKLPSVPPISSSSLIRKNNIQIEEYEPTDETKKVLQQNSNDFINKNDSDIVDPFASTIIENEEISLDILPKELFEDILNDNKIQSNESLNDIDTISSSMNQDIDFERRIDDRILDIDNNNNSNSLILPLEMNQNELVTPSSINEKNIINTINTINTIDTVDTMSPQGIDQYSEPQIQTQNINNIRKKIIRRKRKRDAILSVGEQLLQKERKKYRKDKEDEFREKQRNNSNDEDISSSKSDIDTDEYDSDAPAVQRRSRRQIVPPQAYWKGERIVYRREKSGVGKLAPKPVSIVINQNDERKPRKPYTRRNTIDVDEEEVQLRYQQQYGCECRPHRSMKERLRGYITDFPIDDNDNLQQCIFFLDEQEFVPQHNDINTDSDSNINNYKSALGTKTFEKSNEFSTGMLVLPAKSIKNMERTCSYEILFVCSAEHKRLQIDLNSTKSWLCAGDTCIVPPKSIYEQRNESENVDVRIFFVLVGKFIEPSVSASKELVSMLQNVQDKSMLVESVMSSNNSAMESNGAAARPNGPAVGSNGPAARPNGPAVGSNGPAARPNGPAVGSNGPAARPNGPTVGSNEPAARPNESTVGSNEPAARPNESTVRSNEPAVRPNESTVRSNEPAVRPNESTVGSNEPAAGPNESDETNISIEESTTPKEATSIDTQKRQILSRLPQISSNDECEKTTAINNIKEPTIVTELLRDDTIGETNRTRKQRQQRELLRESLQENDTITDKGTLNFYNTKNTSLNINTAIKKNLAEENEKLCKD